MRLFFALWPEDDVRAALAAATWNLLLRDGRIEPAARLHMTLRFLGDVADAQLERWRAAASEITTPPFSLHLTQAGWWPRSAVAWLGPAEMPSALTALVTALARIDLPAARVEHGFKPHVTAARRVRRAPGLTRRGCPLAGVVLRPGVVPSHAGRQSLRSARALAPRTVRAALSDPPSVQ